jgi:hypothetical protein
MDRNAQMREIAFRKKREMGEHLSGKKIEFS